MPRKKFPTPRRTPEQIDELQQKISALPSPARRNDRAIALLFFAGKFDSIAVMKAGNQNQTPHAGNQNFHPPQPFDGKGKSSIKTESPFSTHMLTLFANMR